jgi:CRP-like cAMP-binding protein
MITFRQDERASDPTAAPANRLLAALPSDDYLRILPHLETVPLRSGESLDTSNSSDNMYFLESGLCSISAVTRDGQVAGVAVIGSEGMISQNVIRGDGVSNERAVLTIADGNAQIMDVGVFHDELRRGAGFYDVMYRYGRAFTESLMQSVACNALHSVEQRYARWVLELRDRLGRDELPVTHDTLAELLGVRRPSITVAANDLHRTGSIDIGRKRIIVRAPAALESAACECYATIKRNFARMQESDRDRIDTARVIRRERRTDNSR